MWRHGNEGRWPWREFIALTLADVVAAGIVFLLAGSAQASLAGRPALWAIFATPILLAIYLLARSLFVAFAGVGERDSALVDAGARDDADREWWARLSGLVLLSMAAWIALGVLTLFGWYLMNKAVGEWTDAALAALGGVAGLATTLLGKSSTTGSKSSSKGSSLSTIALALAAPSSAWRP